MFLFVGNCHKSVTLSRLLSDFLIPFFSTMDDQKSRGGDDDAVTRESKGPMGPVFSSLVYEEEPGNEL